MSVITRGDRELALRFETFPADAAQKLSERISALTEELAARVEAAAPVGSSRTRDRDPGRLRSEIAARVFVSTGEKQRIAGYVSVYAPDRPSEYAKAATLEYGSNRPRRAFEHGSLIRRLAGGKRRIEGKLSRPVHIAAYMYLRRPLDEMRPEIEAALEEALVEASGEA